MGWNHVGQLGDGSAMNRNSPVQVQPGGVIAMSRGMHVLYFFKSDNTLWASGWGGHNGLGRWEWYKSIYTNPTTPPLYQ